MASRLHRNRRGIPRKTKRGRGASSIPRAFCSPALRPGSEGPRPQINHSSMASPRSRWLLPPLTADVDSGVPPALLPPDSPTDLEARLLPSCTGSRMFLQGSGQSLQPHLAPRSGLPSRSLPTHSGVGLCSAGPSRGVSSQAQNAGAAPLLVPGEAFRSETAPHRTH